MYTASILETTILCNFLGPQKHLTVAISCIAAYGLCSRLAVQSIDCVQPMVKSDGMLCE